MLGGFGLEALGNKPCSLSADIGKVHQIAASKFFSAMTMANGEHTPLAVLSHNLPSSGQTYDRRLESGDLDSL